MGLGAEVPLIAFARPMHLRGALAGRVIGRGRRRDDRGDDNCAGSNTNAFAIQIPL
jgi:hypothetical protein